MALEGLHHITAITADAPRNVDFYARTLGLRLVKKTVNFDQPDVYHLYYADERATPGAVLTFFEFPGAPPGRHGDGMPYRILWRVADEAALDHWSARLNDEGLALQRTADGGGVFADPEGLEHELVVEDVPDAPLVAHADDVADEHALQGLAGVRAYASRGGEASAPLLTALGFAPARAGSGSSSGAGAPAGAGDAGNAGPAGSRGANASGANWQVAGTERRARWHYDPPPPGGRGSQGAGSIHHVAWSAADDDELERLRAIAAAAGARPTPIIDRQYFHSVYFREPSGVLFELASRDVGFTVDEPLQSLGEALMLPARHEPLRAELERRLTPIANPRRRSA